MVKDLELSDFDEILNEGDKVSIGLVIEDPSYPPLVRINIHGKNGIKEKIIDFHPAMGTTGDFEFMSFKVAKKQKRLKFPFEIDSFEIGFPSGIKATLKKKKHS